MRLRLRLMPNHQNKTDLSPDGELPLIPHNTHMQNICFALFPSATLTQQHGAKRSCNEKIKHHGASKGILATEPGLGVGGAAEEQERSAGEREASSAAVMESTSTQRLQEKLLHFVEIPALTLSNTDHFNLTC